ncbi:MAG: efflux RND transporter periplasmic adaptor subunit [Deltaproteobacteria bacterium]|nr:efflux RND transporter periplasmic adaptor subunit [Deltaproteobacteria bacterium]
MKTTTALKNTTQIVTRLSTILMAIAMSLYACQSSNQATGQATQAKKSGAKPAKEVSTVKIDKTKFISTLKATGVALPVRESYLSFSVPGHLKTVLVAPGDRVTKGQALMRLDREGFSLGVLQAEAAVAAAQVGLDQLKIEMGRYDRLIKSKSIPRAAYDKVKAHHDGAAAQHTMTEVAVKRARKALRDSELRAPYDGVINDVLKEVGEYIPSMPPTMVAKIVDSSSLEVQIFLPEAEAPFVKVGQQAKIMIDSALVKTHGEVIFVSDRIQPMTLNFEVRIRLDNPEGQIKSGAYTRVEIERSAKDDAIFVPLRAVMHESEGQAFVFVEKLGKASRIKVELGESRGDQTLVTCCLKAGQQVITSGLADISDGDPVTVETN